MNIKQFPVTKAEIQSVTIEGLLMRRHETFRGFCVTEGERGGIDPTIPLSLERGQEQVRILFARMLEELMEAYQSKSPIHMKEELIDAINYGTSMIFLNYQEKTEHLGRLIINLEECMRSEQKMDINPVVLRATFFEVTEAFHPLLESLRNRAWQKTTQHPYFYGGKDIVFAIRCLWDILLPFFKDKEEFIEYYLAKDKVLQFRLKSNY